jgi:hypothetical protein
MWSIEDGSVDYSSLSSQTDQLKTGPAQKAGVIARFPYVANLRERARELKTRATM